LGTAATAVALAVPGVANAGWSWNDGAQVTPDGWSWTGDSATSTDGWSWGGDGTDAAPAG
jgi:hypothetical protein